MKPYIPELLPPQSINWERLVPLIGKANAELALYRGRLQGIVNPEVFLSPLTTQEAVLSSRIEGTEATLVEVLEYEASKQAVDKKGDIHEIINYRTSLQYAVDDLKTRPISLNLIRGLHRILMDSVRGRDKARGEFRTSQNYIGKPGSPIEQASYVPPPPERLMEFLSNLEGYVHYEEKDRLVQLAIVHAQFEIIHPFLDGNGRVGRILIPVFLIEKGLLDSPTFYISAYLEANRDVYVQRLHDISEDNGWHEWIVFFLNAVIEQAKSNNQRAKAVVDLYEQMKEEISLTLKSKFSLQVLDAMFERPVFTTADFVQRSQIPKRSALRILSKLRREEIVTVIGQRSGRKPGVFVFRRLMDIVG